MASGIDHVVIAVSDPDAAAAELTDKVGLAFTAGGRHAGLGTFNRIAFLGDAYLELMGVEDPKLAADWPMGAASSRILERGGGFTTYALVDEAIRITVASLQANGSRIGPVVHGSRERPDGERVEWWSAAPPELGPDRPPFLIKHLEAGAEWGTEALAARRAFVHPIGSPVRLVGLEIAVADPLGLAAECFQLLGVEFLTVGAVAVCTLGPHVMRLVPAAGGDPPVTVMLHAEVTAPRSTSMLGFELIIRP
jgi:catechol 2,3-dioxygenase-like lactoylglutathione lyase family enzyme